MTTTTPTTKRTQGLLARQGSDPHTALGGGAHSHLYKVLIGGLGLPKPLYPSALSSMGDETAGGGNGLLPPTT